jgi:hypothetical protein
MTRPGPRNSCPQNRPRPSDATGQPLSVHPDCWRFTERIRGGCVTERVLVVCVTERVLVVRRTERPVSAKNENNFLGNKFISLSPLEFGPGAFGGLLVAR